MKRIILMMIAAVAMAASCGNPDDAPVTGNGTLTLEADKLEMLADGEDYVEITAKYDGQSVSDGVDFYDAATNVPVKVKDMRFTTKTVGQHSIYAIYNGVKSNTLKINALEYMAPEAPADPDPAGTTFRKRVLLTQFTSTGCTYCPIMTGLLRELAADEVYKDKFVLAASHSDMNGYQNGDDPASYSGASGLMSAFGVLGYPTLIADFGDQLNAYSYDQLKALVDGYYEDGTSVVGVASASEIQGNVLVLRAAVKAGKAGKYRVGAWLLEDGIYGKQTSAPDESYYIHDHCVRHLDAGSHYMGHDLGMISAGKTAEHIFTIKMDPEWKVESCKVLLYVTSSVGNKDVLNNAVVVPVGKPVTYEYR